MSSIPTSKLLIGDLDKEVMSFIYNLRKVRGVVSGKIARIYNAKNKEILVENSVSVIGGVDKKMFTAVFSASNE